MVQPTHSHKRSGDDGRKSLEERGSTAILCNASDSVSVAIKGIGLDALDTALDNVDG